MLMTWKNTSDVSGISNIFLAKGIAVVMFRLSILFSLFYICSLRDELCPKETK